MDIKGTCYKQSAREGLVLFSAWYNASRTLWSALRGEASACDVAKEVEEVTMSGNGMVGHLVYLSSPTGLGVRKEA